MVKLSDYITQNNPKGAVRIVMEHGFNRPANAIQTTNAIDSLIKRDGQDFLFKLAKIHPDLELIEASTSMDKKSDAAGEGANMEELKATFIKEMKKADERTSNLTGSEKINTEMIVIGGAFLIAAIIIIKAF